MTRRSYGTIDSNDSEYREQQETLLLKQMSLFEPTTQRKRWTETLLYLIPLFLGVFSMEGCSLSWKTGEAGSSFAGSMWTGFGGSLGALCGRMVRAIFVMRSPNFRLSHEIDEGLIMALSLMFGPSSMFYSILSYCVSENLSLIVSYLLMLTICAVSYFGAPLLFRGLLSIYKGERAICEQTRKELWWDIYLSLSVGNGFAFLIFTSTDLSSHSIFSLLGVVESNNSFVSMFLYGFVFSVGFLILQTLQNFLSHDTWTDVDN